MTTEDRTIELLEQMNQHLALIAKVITHGNIAGLKQRDAVERLAAFGLNAKAISSVTGYGVSSVAPILSRLKNRPDNDTGRKVGRGSSD